MNTLPRGVDQLIEREAPPMNTLPFGVDQLIEREAPLTPVVYDDRLQMSLHKDAPVIAEPSLAGPWMATNFKGDKTAPKWD